MTSATPAGSTLATVQAQLGNEETILSRLRSEYNSAIRSPSLGRNCGDVEAIRADLQGTERRVMRLRQVENELRALEGRRHHRG
jgi:hypothetical protein